LAVPEGEQDLDDAGQAGTTEQVSKVGLDRTDVAFPALLGLAKEAGDGPGLDRITNRCPGAVGFQVRNRLGLAPSFCSFLDDIEGLWQDILDGAVHLGALPAKGGPHLCGLSGLILLQKRGGCKGTHRKGCMFESTEKTAKTQVRQDFYRTFKSLRPLRLCGEFFQGSQVSGRANTCSDAIVHGMGLN
jgi:hypothetical protein